MKQEIIELIAKTRNVVENVETFTFNNNKGKYTILAAGYAEVKEHIDIIEMNLDKFDDELLEKAKSDLNYIINTLEPKTKGTEIPVSEAVIENKTTIDETTMEPSFEETIDTQNLVEPTNEYSNNDAGSIDFNEEELNNLLAALDNTNFDALLDESNTEGASKTTNSEDSFII